MSAHGIAVPGGDPSDNQMFCFQVTEDDLKDQLGDVIREAYEREDMLDVTLCVQGERIRAHRPVLYGCSEFFKEIFNQTNHEETVFIIDDVCAEDMKSLIHFIYYGQVQIEEKYVDRFLEACHFLKIFGFSNIAGFEFEESSETSNDQDICEFDTSSEANLTDTHISDSNTSTEIPLPSFSIENHTSITDNQKTPSTTDFKKALSTTNIKKSQSIATTEDAPSLPVQPTKRRRLSDCPLGIKLTKRKSSLKRVYTDEQLEAAIADIRAGKSLIDTAIQHKIPRSTLYVRAKVLNIPLAPTKNDYTHEDMRAAIKLVLAGSSLQQSADCYGIPKTVLWRRIQKEGCYRSRRDKKTYPEESRKAAVKALEKGEPLCKVSQEYQIPKTTLFRDKTKLIDQGKLPSTMYKKRSKVEEEIKSSRLEEAVAACKDGIMSQSAASVRFQVPKTTIWRRLQKNKTSNTGKGHTCKTNNITFVKNGEDIDDNFEDYLDQTDENLDAAYTYVNENQIPSESVIVLTQEDVESLNIPNEESVVLVEQDNVDTNFVSCGLHLDDSSQNVIEMKFRMDK
ncbi:uncharacterized protein LOC106654809 [Trichogramma pretiosum]|uniref:uncharacterized protein LOC106654809 n=1 Tax=Trichogramma pretiosum TaxID=7493 RepID=UPI0006C9730E|nr:uncharacterized protein LOC106654809 [Trichogramma pretiosum]